MHIAYAVLYVCKQRRRVYAYSKVPIVLSSWAAFYWLKIERIIKEINVLVGYNCAAKALFSCPAIISQRLEPRITSNEPLENTEEESKII